MAKKSKKRRRTIKRQDIRRPVDTRETFEDLEKRVGKVPRDEALTAGTTGPTVNLARNSRDKLAMSKQDKFSSAWKIVKRDDPRDSIASTANLSGVATSTVDNMRRVWRTIKGGKHDETMDLQELTWAMARRIAEGR